MDTCHRHCCLTQASHDHQVYPLLSNNFSYYQSLIGASEGCLKGKCSDNAVGFPADMWKTALPHSGKTWATNNMA